MTKKGKHLIFYDGACGLCHWIVRFLTQKDKNGLFLFSPLQGETAHKFLSNKKLLFAAETIILMLFFQNSKKRKPLYFATAALRILWLLGGRWRILGFLSFMPPFFFNWIYRWIARHRFQWFSKKKCTIPKKTDPDRFLP